MNFIVYYKQLRGDAMKFILEVILYLYIYSFLGWACESIYCSVGNRKIINRGFLSGPLCPIYGLGALAIIYLLKMYTNNIILLFVYGTIITSSLEYLGGYLLEKIFNTRWWDYSRKIFNIKGRICLKNSTLFGIMCVLLVKVIHPLVTQFTQVIPLPLLIGTTIIISIIFLIDLSFTIDAINKLNNKLRGVDDAIIESSKMPEKLQEELYFNKILFIKEKSILQRRIINAFPNMKHNHKHEQLQFVAKIIKEKIK